MLLSIQAFPEASCRRKASIVQRSARQARQGHANSMLCQV